jgi:hypothetical protein
MDGELPLVTNAVDRRPAVAEHVAGARPAGWVLDPAAGAFAMQPLS